MARAGRRLGLGAIAAALALGAVIVSAPPGHAAAPTVVHHATTKSKALPTPGLKKIESVALTAGTWSILAKATASDPGATDFFRCQIRAGTKPLDGATTQLSSAAIAHDTITDVAVLKTKTDVTVTQVCGHDGDAGDAGAIDAGASIVAFVTPASRVRITHTTAQTPLPNQVETAVTNLSLPKGEWIVAAKFSPVNLSGPTVNTACGIGGEIAVPHLLGPVSGGLHGVSTVLHLEPISLGATSTITLSCETADNGTYMDPNTVLWAWKATDLVASAGDVCPLTAAAAAATDALVLVPRNCGVGAGNFATQLAGATLRNGTWVAIAALDDFVPDGTSVATCELLNASRNTAFDTASATLPGGAATPDTQITQLGVITVAKHAEVDGRCGETGSPDPPYANNTNWAFIRP